VKTYVNDWTLNLGPLGKEALKVLAELAFESGVASSPKNRVNLDIIE